MRLAAISVDLDEIPNYFQIHGLPPPEGPESSLVYDVAIESPERPRGSVARYRSTTTRFD